MWQSATEPPKAEQGLSSEPVVIFTNLENAFVLSYFGTKEDGIWQRPSAFKKGEKVEWWTRTPGDDGTRDA